MSRPILHGILKSIPPHCSQQAGTCEVAEFHSHPNGVAVPSATDIAQAAPDGRFWLIIAAGAITAWQPVVTGAQVTGFTPVALIVEG
jgi:proteasome lid subunit RPN8/RPN11